MTTMKNALHMNMHYGMDGLVIFGRKDAKALGCLKKWLSDMPKPDLIGEE